MHRFTFAFVIYVATVGLASPSVGANVSVATGASVDIASSTVDLACGDLELFGAFDVSGGFVSRVHDVAIEASGTLLGGTGTVEVTGDWDNGLGGVFTAETGSVHLVDGCGESSASLLGSSTFSDLRIESTSGKAYAFAQGVTQTITGSLFMSGAEGVLLVLRSNGAAVATFSVPAGQAVASWVDAADIHFSPNAIDLVENSTLSGDTSGWTARSCGDIDGLGGVTAADLTLARRHLLGVAVSGNITFCNVMGVSASDGSDCNLLDIVSIQRFVHDPIHTLSQVCVPQP